MNPTNEQLLELAAFLYLRFDESGRKNYVSSGPFLPWSHLHPARQKQFICLAGDFSRQLGEKTSRYTNEIARLQSELADARIDLALARLALTQGDPLASDSPAEGQSE